MSTPTIPDLPDVDPKNPDSLRRFMSALKEIVQTREARHFRTLSDVRDLVGASIDINESAHAVAWAMRVAPTLSKDTHILVNLSGRGDKDADYVAKLLGI